MESSTRKSVVSPSDRAADQHGPRDPDPAEVDIGLVVIGLIWAFALVGTGLLVWTLVGR